MWANQDRRLPVPPVRPFAQGVLWGKIRARIRRLVNAIVVTVLVAYVGGVVVPRINLYLHAIAAK